MNTVILNRKNIEQQFFVQSGEDMRCLLSPLKPFGITHFSNVRGYDDGSKTILTTHPGFTILFFNQRFYQYAFAAKPQEYQQGIVLTEDLINVQQKKNIIVTIREACMQHDNFQPDLIFIEKGNNYVDFFFFGAEKSRQYMPTFYVTHLDVFHQYLRFFKWQAKRLLKKSQETHLLYEDRQGDSTFLVSRNFQKQLNMPDKHVNILSNGRQVFLTENFTKKEWLTACYLQSGFSPREIAIKLSISPRTIEKHVLNLRSKTKSRNIVHLISRLNELNWLDKQ